MQITIDPNKLNESQRELLAALVLSYLNVDLEDNTGSVMNFSKNEIESLKINLQSAVMESISELTPEQAFGAVEVLNTGSFNMKPEDVQAANAAGANLIQNQDGTHSIAFGGALTDKNGFPWDTRIHSSNKQKTSDGIWRKRRGVDDATVMAVEAELRQVMGAPAPLAQAPAVVSDPVVTAPPPPPQAVGVAVPLPPAPLPSSDPNGPRNEYVALIGRASAAQAHKKITPEQVKEVCTKYGVVSLPLLVNRLELLPQVAAEIDALIAIGG